MADPKSDCEELLSAAVPFAKQMLANEREFYPFAVSMSQDGKITPVDASTGEEHPASRELMGLLEESLRSEAAEGPLQAAAIAYDVMVVPPGREEPQDAIAVALDHRADYSVVVVFPYTFAEDGEPLVEDPYAMDGEHRIFAS